MNKWQEKVNFGLGWAMDEIKALTSELRDIVSLSECLADVSVTDGYLEHPSLMDLKVAQRAVAEKLRKFDSRFWSLRRTLEQSLRIANAEPLENELIGRAENFQESVNSISK